MDTNEYKVIITPTAFKEMNRIYDYILDNLYAEKAAKDLMKQIEKKVQNLKYAHKIHTEIEKNDELQRKYRRIIIKNYIILYTVDDNNKVVFVSHIYYKGKNYLEGLL